MIVKMKKLVILGFKDEQWEIFPNQDCASMSELMIQASVIARIGFEHDGRWIAPAAIHSVMPVEKDVRV